jgi:hypothetical protein
MKEAKLFMSDQFAMNEEAGGQYNCHPFFTEKHKIVAWDRRNGDGQHASRAVLKAICCRTDAFDFVAAIDATGRNAVEKTAENLKFH